MPKRYIEPDPVIEKITDYEFTLNGIKFICDYKKISYPESLQDDEFEVIELHKEVADGELEIASEAEVKMVTKWLSS